VSLVFKLTKGYPESDSREVSISEKTNREILGGGERESSKAPVNPYKH